MADPGAVSVIIPAMNEAAAIGHCEQGIVQRGADIADMEPASRRRGEAGDDHQPLPVWNALLIG